MRTTTAAWFKMISPQLSKLEEPQRHPPFPQPAKLPPPPQPKPPHPNSSEAALEKLTLSTASFIQSTNNFMHFTNNFIEESRSNFKNQESAIRNLETQVGQLAKQISTRSPNTFLSDTIENPREECKSIVLRSGARRQL
ncbi:hypothetical protein PIB30_084216 [Stylosanthes scabra]|uniref:Uncharacterized protein n=1 Tax=Stylosanthes scabra TaxID=79078 RepID=A0ABU6SSP9_9FABA|nr:hypothetical protein [Stylosanthes scabra]